ncbi:MAG: hypothetical protein WCT42_03615 [Candidatus Paceibacterota bacterium]
MDKQIKKCSHCQEEIPLEAKRCSHCQADLRSWPRRHPVIIAIIILFFISVFIGALSPKSDLSKSGTVLSPQAKTIEIVSVETKSVEKNSVWWKYSWVITLKNTSIQDKIVNAELSWKDKDSFTIEKAQEYNLNIPANSEKTFSGYKLIDIQIAPTVSNISAEIK